jgi:CRP/FNR family cyclic AMP-dependent transcriptional regulator
LFSHTSALERSAVARHAQERQVDDGTVLVEQGTPGDAFYVLLDGRAHAVRDGEKVAELGTGDWFGELALLDGEPRSATVVADGPLTVAVLPTATFRLALREFPDLTEQLLAALASQLRQASAPAHH